MNLMIGIGNDYRRDDGAGLVAARKLKGKNIADFSIIEVTGEGAAIMEAWSGANSVFILDAVSSGGTPGSIHRIEAHAQTLPRHLFKCSTHAFGLAEAVELSRAMNQLPRRLIIYGIEGKSFEVGIGLSPEVNHAVEQAVDQLHGEIHAQDVDHR